MPIFTKQSGAFTEASLTARLSGSYQYGTLFGKINGTWAQIWPPLPETETAAPVWTASTSAFTVNPSANVPGYFEVKPDGTIYAYLSGTSGVWLPEGATASNYEAMWTLVSGTCNYSTTENSWHDLASTTLRVGTNRNGTSSITGTADITIRHKVFTGSAITVRVTVNSRSS